MARKTWLDLLKNLHEIKRTLKSTHTSRENSSLCSIHLFFVFITKWQHRVRDDRDLFFNDAQIGCFGSDDGEYERNQIALNDHVRINP